LEGRHPSCSEPVVQGASLATCFCWSACRSTRNPHQLKWWSLCARKRKITLGVRRQHLCIGHWVISAPQWCMSFGAYGRTAISFGAYGRATVSCGCCGFLIWCNSFASSFFLGDFGENLSKCDSKQTWKIIVASKYLVRITNSSAVSWQTIEYMLVRHLKLWHTQLVVGVWCPSRMRWCN
jgi:hypothetical protein